MKIKASFLKYAYTKVTAAGDKPPFTGLPDGKLFHRKEVYEILPMLQKVVDELDLRKKSDVHELEDLIHLKLPVDIRTRGEVYCWLIQHFPLGSRIQTLEKAINRYLEDIINADN